MRRSSLDFLAERLDAANASEEKLRAVNDRTYQRQVWSSIASITVVAQCIMALLGPALGVVVRARPW